MLILKKQHLTPNNSHKVVPSVAVLSLFQHTISRNTWSFSSQTYLKFFLFHDLSAHFSTQCYTWNQSLKHKYVVKLKIKTASRKTFDTNGCGWTDPPLLYIPEWQRVNQEVIRNVPRTIRPIINTGHPHLKRALITVLLPSTIRPPHHQRIRWFLRRRTVISRG